MALRGQPMSKAKRVNPVILKAGMSIGPGNAESDDDLLFECFVTYPPVDEALKIASAGMILAGRTGSGKTAILRYVQTQEAHTSKVDPAEMSMNYVANSDALRFLHAIGADLDLLFQVLWKHVLCLEFIRLRWGVDNAAKSATILDKIVSKFTKDDRKKRAVAYLQEWGNKFWITMEQNIKEITEAYENKLNAEFGAEISKFKAGGQYEKRRGSARSRLIHPLSRRGNFAEDARRRSIHRLSYRRSLGVARLDQRCHARSGPSDAPRRVSAKRVWSVEAHKPDGLI